MRKAIIHERAVEKAIIMMKFFLLKVSYHKIAVVKNTFKHKSKLFKEL